VIRIPNGHFWGKRKDFLPSENPWTILKPLNFFEFASSRMGYFPEPLAFSIRAFLSFRKHHFHQPFDVIHDVETLGYGLLLARKLGVPAVSTVHHPLHRDLDAYLMQARSWTERFYNVVFFPLLMQGFVARRIDGMITSSEVGIQELQRCFRLKSHSIHLVYTGVQLDIFSPDPHVTRNPCEILFVGNAQDPRKGILYLLHALKALPQDVHLKIVDEDEPRKNHAPGLVRALKLGERVTFTGKVLLNDLVRLYRRASVVVMPSLHEGFGLPAAEAMACCTPVVATRTGSLPEVVGEDQGGGILVPPRDSKALAEAICQIISQPLMAKELGGRGRRRVERLFSWTQTAQRTAEVYRRVIKDSKQP
jgi:glycosyltransferase involved in cell wall biosynthesis